jgi:hypothetical protein
LPKLDRCQVDMASAPTSRPCRPSLTPCMHACDGKGCNIVHAPCRRPRCACTAIRSQARIIVTRCL